MAKIAIDRAPPTALPRRFLLTAPCWGAVAGLLLLVDGELALQTRWGPSTLALVHAFTLGMLGNAMFGSLLQFLPAAAGAPVAGGARAGFVLHGLLNGGAVLLVAGFRAMHPSWLAGAGVVLAVAFALLACLVMPGLWRAHGQRLLRVGIAFACAAGLVAAALGIAMLCGLIGRGGLPLLPWANIHAAWGVLGWVLGLVASVGTVVMPMFQGTRAVPAGAQAGWLALLALVLVLGTACLVFAQRPAVLQWGGAACLAVFASAGLWLQWRARHARNVWLVRLWRTGLLALLGAAAVVAVGGPSLLAGALVLGVALPWLVLGMQLEIVAFLGWIDLHRRCGRGLRLPAIQVLLPDADKAAVFVLQASAALGLLAACVWPHPVGARAAGLLLLSCHAWSWWTLQAPTRRGRAFLQLAARTAGGGGSHGD